jgi:cell division transport system permease protein
VISISLVLFLIGILGMIIINANSYIDYLREQMVIEVFFKNSSDPKTEVQDEKNQLQYLDSVRAYSYVKSVKYIAKTQATQIAKKELGVDTEALFESDIYPASVTVSLKSQYIDSAHIETVKRLLQKNTIVDEVKSDSALLSKMNRSIDKVIIGTSVLTVIILIIAISLINNSIRLKIFSKRFIIKTMQLVGARRFFIMKPFLIQAVWLGTLGAVIALILLFCVDYALIHYDILPPVVDYTYYILLSVFIILLGIIITTASTHLATWRYLGLRLDDLYYS